MALHMAAACVMVVFAPGHTMGVDGVADVRDMRNVRRVEGERSEFRELMGVVQSSLQFSVQYVESSFPRKSHPLV